ncbi:MAG: polyprenyl diphosphate synthase [Candidatus Saccharimonas sp.]
MPYTIPVHVGYIVDGNRRWAEAHGIGSFEGHQIGYEKLKEVLIETLHRGVQYTSAFVFSTENWKRSSREVNYLMDLFVRVLIADIPVFVRENVRVRIVGSRDRLSQRVLRAIDRAESATAHLTGGQLLLCLNYGGHLEIVDAVKRIVAAKVSAQDVTEAMIAESLYAPEVPACDMIVRTSGEQRLSNFMLWRSAYSELLFLDKLWPDMTKQDVPAILEEYTRRQRRFGG